MNPRNDVVLIYLKAKTYLKATSCGPGWYFAIYNWQIPRTHDDGQKSLHVYEHKLFSVPSTISWLCLQLIASIIHDIVFLNDETWYTLQLVLRTNMGACRTKEARIMVCGWRTTTLNILCMHRWYTMINLQCTGVHRQEVLQLVHWQAKWQHDVHANLKLWDMAKWNTKWVWAMLIQISNSCMQNSFTRAPFKRNCVAKCYAVAGTRLGGLFGHNCILCMSLLIWIENKQNIMIKYKQNSKDYDTVRIPASCQVRLRLNPNSTTSFWKWNVWKAWTLNIYTSTHWNPDDSLAQFKCSDEACTENNHRLYCYYQAVSKSSRLSTPANSDSSNSSSSAEKGTRFTYTCQVKKNPDESCEDVWLTCIETCYQMSWKLQFSRIRITRLLPMFRSHVPNIITAWSAGSWRTLTCRTRPWTNCIEDFSESTTPMNFL